MSCFCNNVPIDARRSQLKMFYYRFSGVLIAVHVKFLCKLNRFSVNYRLCFQCWWFWWLEIAGLFHIQSQHAVIRKAVCVYWVSYSLNKQVFFLNFTTAVQVIRIINSSTGFVQHYLKLANNGTRVFLENFSIFQCRKCVIPHSHTDSLRLPCLGCIRLPKYDCVILINLNLRL